MNLDFSFDAGDAIACLALAASIYAVTSARKSANDVQKRQEEFSRKNEKLMLLRQMLDKSQAASNMLNRITSMIKHNVASLADPAVQEEITKAYVDLRSEYEKHAWLFHEGDRKKLGKLVEEAQAKIKVFDGTSFGLMAKFMLEADETLKDEQTRLIGKT